MPRHATPHNKNTRIPLNYAGFVLYGAALCYFSLQKEADAQAAGAVTINYGIIISSIISFLIVAIAVFMVIRNINRLKKEEEAPPAEPTTKDCSLFQMTIPIKATKCGHCTAELKVSA